MGTVKTRRSKRTPSEKQLQTREYKRDLHKLEERCQEKQIDIRSYKRALANDICVLSLSEFEIGEHKQECDEKNKPIFMDELDYEYFYQ